MEKGHSDPIMLSHMELWEDTVMASTADLVCDRGTMLEVARRIAALPPGLGQQQPKIRGKSTGGCGDAILNVILYITNMSKVR